MDKPETSPETRLTVAGDNYVMTPPEAAEYLRVLPQTLAHWRHQGTGPKFTRMSRTRIVYRKGDLDRFLETKTYQSTAEYKSDNQSATKKSSPVDDS